MKKDALLAPAPVAPPQASLSGESHVRETLSRLSLEKKRMDSAKVVAQGFVLAAASLLVLALLDYCYFWTVAQRVVISLGWWTIVFFCLWRFTVERRRPVPIEAVALDWERRLSPLHCEISTAAQYAQQSISDADKITGELVRGLHRHAALHLQKIHSPYRPWLWLWSGLVAWGSLVAALVWMFSPACQIAAKRIAFPWTLSHYTEVEVQPGDVEIAANTDLKIKAQFNGRLPLTAKIAYRGADGAWKTDVMTQNQAGDFSHLFKNLQGEITYRVYANDAITRDYHVKTYALPEIASMEVAVIPPAYAHIPSSRSTVGNITALRGSELHWRLLSTMPLAKATFCFEKNLAALDLNAESPQSWSTALTLKETVAYQVSLRNLKNQANRKTGPFHLVALPDAPPSVVISSPEPNITAGPQDKITIDVQANDDIGLAEVNLITQRPGSPLQTTSILPKGNLGRHAGGGIVLDLAPLNLKPYDVVTFYAEARDNNTCDGPGVARSPVHFVTIGAVDPGADSGSAGKGKQVNLMQLERDLIGATSNGSLSAPPSVLADLGASQTEIQGYAEIVLHELQMAASTAPPKSLLDAPLDSPLDPVTPMSAAIDNMKQATKDLNAGDGAPAVDQEVQALANLYQVVRLLPPSQGGGATDQLMILLEDLRKAKQAREDKKQKEISAVLAQAAALLKEQTSLQKSTADRKESQNKGQGQAAGNASKDSSDQGPSALAEQQQQLADKALALAERLSRAAGNNSSLSHQMGEETNAAANQMHVAAEGLQNSGQPEISSVDEAQARAVDALGRVVQALNQLSKKPDANPDVDGEGEPPEYAEQLSRYYQKLSHEQ